MTVLNEKHKKWVLYHQLQKCGIVSISQDFLLMGLNCSFCSIICTRLEEFLKHIKKVHLQEVLELYGLSKETTTSVKPQPPDTEEHKSNSFVRDFFENTDDVEEVAIKLEPHLFDSNIDGDDNDGVSSMQQDEFLDHFGDNDPFEDHDENNDDNSTVEQLKQVESIFIKEEKSSSWQNKNDDEASSSKKRSNKRNSKNSRKTKTNSDTDTKSDLDLNVKTEKTSPVKRTKQNSSVNYKEQDSDVDYKSSNDDTDFEPKAEVIDSDENETDTSHRTKINIFDESMHDVVSHIIDYYEKNPIVWNPQHFEFSKSNKKLSVLKDLTLELEIRFQISLQPKDLRRIFVDLRRLYYKELKNMDSAISSSKLWFFDKMKFLPKQKEDTKSQKLYPTLSVADEHLLAVAKAYEEFPTLWNSQIEGYRDKNLRNEALEQLRQKLENKPSVAEIRMAITRMRNHYMSDKAKRIKCAEETKDFKPSYGKLYEQLQFLETHIGPYRCSFEGCTVGLIRSYDKFVAHIAAHEGRKGFTCKYCNQDYSTFGNLEIHIRRRHTHETPFKCPFCEKSFTTSADLNTHKNIHQGVKPFICHLCGKGFPSSSYLSRHYMRHDPETYQFQCPQCPKKFCEKYRLREHLNSHMQLREHICGVCGKGFFAHKTLKQHEQLHSEVTRYECNLCGKRFKQISAMYSHKKCHHNAVNFGDV